MVHKVNKPSYPDFILATQISLEVYTFIHTIDYLPRKIKPFMLI
jgi:hypothetical protein